MEEINRLSDIIFDIKHLLKDADYKRIMETLMKLTKFFKNQEFDDEEVQEVQGQSFYQLLEMLNLKNSFSSNIIYKN